MWYPVLCSSVPRRRVCGVLSCSRLFHLLGLQPGVASVHASILQKSVNSTSFYLRHFPQFEGMSYGEVRRCFATALVVGLFSGADNCPRLNPKDTEILTKDDKVVLLSNTSESCSRPLERTCTVYAVVVCSIVVHRLLSGSLTWEHSDGRSLRVIHHKGQQVWLLVSTSGFCKGLPEAPGKEPCTEHHTCVCRAI